MHPALSVIAFTTLSGAGYGLAFFLSLGFANPADPVAKVAWILALVLIGAGLVCSTLHLGNPQRAWRAFSQWRSSWLSREGCLAIVTFVPLTILAAGAIFAQAHSTTLGFVAAILCIATVYCTAMIYASLRTVASWNTNLTVFCYIDFALAGGMLLFNALFPQSGLGLVSLMFLLLAWLVKFMWARRAAEVEYGGSTMETATGLGKLGTVRLLERPHMMGNYLTNEMCHRVGRKHAAMLWRIAITLGLIVPATLLLITLVFATGTTAIALAWIAAVSHLCGIFVERWLFFATARHAVSLYYGGDEALQPAE